MAAKLTFIILTFNLTFINMSHGDIKKKKTFKTRPKPKVNVQLCWVSLFSKSTRIKTTASGLSYGVGVNGEKKNGNWDIKKNGHSTFHTDKPGKFDILREVI